MYVLHLRRVGEEIENNYTKIKHLTLCTVDVLYIHHPLSARLGGGGGGGL